MEMKARLDELQREFEKMKQQLNQAQEQAKAQPGAAAENPAAASDLVEELPLEARPYQPLFYNQTKQLSFFEASQMLDMDMVERRAIPALPDKPKAGTVYLVKVDTDSETEDWRACGHRFTQVNGGYYGGPGHNILKRKHNLLTPDCPKKPGTPKFQMISFNQKQFPHVVLVQFIGDDSLSVDFPLANSKSDDPYFRTAPSAIRRAEVSTAPPAATYRDDPSNAKAGIHSQKFKNINNSRQARNAKYRFRTQHEGTDEFVKLIELASEMSELKLLITHPDLIAVIAEDEMIKQVREILKLDYYKTQHKQTLGYDTQV